MHFNINTLYNNCTAIVGSTPTERQEKEGELKRDK
jgi:hypothetical protein